MSKYNPASVFHRAHFLYKEAGMPLAGSIPEKVGFI